MRRGRFLLVVLALVAAACARETRTTTPPKGTTPTEAEGPRTVAVQVDGESEALNGEFFAFFPDEVRVHPGDRVAFRMPHFPGVPHTVTLGTLVDSAVKKLEQLGPDASFNDQEESSELLNLPDVFPHELPKGGPPDANQSASQPCFLDSGVPPLSLSGSAPACPKRSQPAFDGRQSFYNSGALFTDGASFTVPLADSIQPGTYNVICLVHRGEMTGTVRVVPREGPVPSPEEVTRAGQEQFAAVVAGLQPAVDQLRAATADRAAAGAGVPTVRKGIVAEFGPKELSIRPGQTVSWTLFGFHSISFNVPEDAVGVLVKAADGSVHLNPKAGAPVNNPEPPLQALVFPAPRGAGLATMNGGTFDGAGFKNTGVLGSLPPAFITYQLTFPNPGTFEVRCVLHPDMRGTVKVT